MYHTFVIEIKAGAHLFKRLGNPTDDVLCSGDKCVSYTILTALTLYNTALIQAIQYVWCHGTIFLTH